MKRTLVTGACGQLGSELSLALEKQLGAENLVISDISEPPDSLSHLKFIKLDVLDQQAVEQAVEQLEVSRIYHLAAMLSATGEHNPRMAWILNMDGLINILESSKLHKIETVFWPSSIAAFGPHTIMDHTPQHSIMDPETIYGISKLSGELWCQYYHDRFGVDVRSLRYPGLISYKSPPGGGTTDYAVAIFHSAVKGDSFECFLDENTRLPMMYMSDAINATLKLMESPTENISIRTSYNLSAFSVTPGELTAAIQQYFPDFTTEYKPDFRNLIAKTWPQTVDDGIARKDWGWQNQFNLQSTVELMINKLRLSTNSISAGNRN